MPRLAMAQSLASLLPLAVAAGALSRSSMVAIDIEFLIAVSMIIIIIVASSFDQL